MGRAWVAYVLGGLLVAVPAEAQRAAVILATTTSTQDSGLLDVVVPLFEQNTGHTVKTIAVGTGQSLALGDRGEADVVLVHAPKLELEYLAKGNLINRRLVMHNDFILVGPAADTAGIKGVRKAADALKKIAETRGTFVSRGDNSGTHNTERSLWKTTGVAPKGRWYIESGQGMGATLIIASEKGAYALTDRGTYRAMQKRVRLAILLEGDTPLLNVYHVMEVNPARHPRVNAAGGRAFADFIVSAEAQAVIRTFGVEKYGAPLFFPDAGKPKPGT
ncbi:MAG: substrate-binding domain-containing protein [Candidatus Rokubacteria bacterium]|nr:substrate-binding domain-containing protein [Candidatus Rokubacteria bacterium]MBI3029773.1 substrate-binding domain-containing protein [Candidatus Rokubacteria bacterium]